MANGSTRYTYNTAGYLTKVENYTTEWQTQSEMTYDGLGNRLEVTTYSDGEGNTTRYVLDGGAELVNEAKFGDDNLLQPASDFIRSQKRILMVEIPANIQLIKQTDIALATAWRNHSRRLFEHFFDHNYLITDFVRRLDDRGLNRSYYIMIHGDA